MAKGFSVGEMVASPAPETLGARAQARGDPAEVFGPPLLEAEGGGWHCLSAASGHACPPRCTGPERSTDAASLRTLPGPGPLGMPRQLLPGAVRQPGRAWAGAGPALCSGTSWLVARAQPLQNPSPRPVSFPALRTAARRPGRAGHHRLRLLMLALSSGDTRPAHVSTSVPPARQPGATVPMSSEAGTCGQERL